MLMENIQLLFKSAKNVEIEQCNVPKLGDYDILVKTELSLVSSGTELTILRGESPRDSFWAKYGNFPFVPGYSNIGKVIDVGKKVDPAKIGKIVASYAPHALFAVTDEKQSYIVPENVAVDDAVFFTISEIAMNGIRKGKITWGESVVIFGAGLLGQVAARLLLNIGVHKVFVIDKSHFRLNLLPKSNRLYCFDSFDETVVDKIQQENNGSLVDCVIELTGNPDLLPKEIKALRDEGRFVILSSPSGPSSFDFHDLCNLHSFQIIGAHNCSHPMEASSDNPWTKRRHNELFFSAIQKQDVDRPSSLITHRYHYRQAKAAYTTLLESLPSVGAMVLEWD